MEPDGMTSEIRVEDKRICALYIAFEVRVESAAPLLARIRPRIARCDALEISDAVVAARSRQREDGALRVQALDDPSAARHLERAVDDAAAGGLHALHRYVDVADVEVVEPEGDRRRRRLGAYTTDRLSSDGEQLIRVPRVAVCIRLLPTEELAVESPCLLPIGGEQLMPADGARSAQSGGLCLAALQPREQCKHRHLRVDGNRNAADVGDARRRDVHCAAKFYDLLGARVHVVDADISQPARAHAHLSSVL